MYRKHLWAGLVLLAMGVTGVQAAPVKRVARSGARVTRVVKARPAAKRPVPARLSSRPAAPAVSRMATRAPVKRRPFRRVLLAQAAVSDAPMMAAVSREAEPLMLRALGAYYVTDEAALRDLRGRGWSFADLATAGNLAARSHRSLYEVARNYEQRRDWTMVARDMNVSPDEVYVAANSPRYVMVRPTPEEEARLIASMTPASTPATIAQAPDATAPEAPAPPATTVAPGAPPTTAVPTAPPSTAVAPGAPETRVPPVTPPGATAAAPEAATPPPATPDATGALAPETAPMPTRTIMTPVERVAASRLELVPREPATLLRSAVATYYALPASTVRQLESQGWALGDILIAGNLAHRSEASLEEVVALHDEGNDWNAIASRIGVAPEQIYQPTMIRRVSAIPEDNYRR